MQSLIRAALVAGAMLAAPLTAAAEPVTYEALKTMVAALGYTTKDVGVSSPKMEVLVTTSEFNVPLGVEITKSGRFIWVTANLGPSKITPDRALEMLKKSTDIQPTQFWITSSNTLTIGLAVDNRDVTGEYLKYIFEKVASDVSKSSALWQVPDPPTGTGQ